MPVPADPTGSVPPTLERDKQELARILGAANIRTEAPRWLSLMREGVVIKLHVRRWRAKCRLDADDLGLPKEDDDLIGDLLELGDKRLLPLDLAKQLEAIESAGRKALERNGYATYWGVFVPATNFAQWQAENETHKRRYFEAREQIVSEYDSILAQLTDAYRGAARVAFRRARALTPDGMTRQDLIDEFYFVDHFVRRIRSLIPSASEIERSFAWEEEYSYIPLPSLLAEDLREKERIERERERERMEAELARDELWKEIAIRDEADRERRQKLARMNDEVVAEARRKKQQLIDTFLKDVVVQLRTTIYEATTDVLKTMQKNQGKLHPRSVVQLKNLIEQIGSLNFFGDEESSRMIARVRDTFERRPEARNVEDIRSALEDVAIVTRASLIDLGETPRASALLGDPEATGPEELALARRRLDLDEPVAVDVALFRRTARAAELLGELVLPEAAT